MDHKIRFNTEKRCWWLIKTAHTAVRVFVLYRNLKKKKAILLIFIFEFY